MPKHKINIVVGPWVFSPRLRMSILVCITFSALVYLGFWQLHRAEQKKTFIQSMEDRTSLDPIYLKSMERPTLHHDRFLPVKIEGIFLNQFTFLLDNQTFDRQAGFRVITPMQSPHLERWVLVDRGWIPMNINRQDLPKIDPIFGLQTVTGVIDTIPTGIIWVPDEVKQNPTWPLIIEDLDYHLIELQIKHLIYKFVIQMKEGEKGAFTIPPHNLEQRRTKNLGYALQWFTFAGMVLIYYVVISSRRKK